MSKTVIRSLVPDRTVLIKLRSGRHIQVFPLCCSEPIDTFELEDNSRVTKLARRRIIRRIDAPIGEELEKMPIRRTMATNAQISEQRGRKKAASKKAASKKAASKKASAKKGHSKTPKRKIAKKTKTPETVSETARREVANLKPEIMK